MQEIKEPYLDMRYRPKGRWFGTPPPRLNPNNPCCPQCAKNDRVEIHQYTVIDSDGEPHNAVYHCMRCDKLF